MAAETDLDHLQEIGYVILKRRIEPQLVKDARTSIEERVRSVTNVSPTEHYVSLYNTSDDWPMDCKRVYHETMVDGEMTSLKTHDG